MQRLATQARRLLLALAAHFMLCLPVQAQGMLLTFHIPSKPLADALVEFAMQAGISVDDSGIDFHGIASSPIDGTFTQGEALRRLLAGSHFAFDFVDASAVRIRAVYGQTMLKPVPQSIENVVVTATKRNESAEVAPYAVAVIDTQQIQELGEQSPRDLTSQVAGLTATNLGPGEDKLFVRGLTDSVLPGLSQSVVAIYLDETRVADDAPDPNLQLIDVDRVEVLRGPQGSLYGAGSLAGLVRIVTHKPVFDEFQMMTGSTISAIDGGGISDGFQAMLNLPIVRNALALRIVGYFDDMGGYVDDTRLDVKNANRSGLGGMRAAIGWQPNGTWNVTANLAWQNTNTSDSQYYNQALGPMNRDNYLREPYTDRLLLASITATGDLGWANLVSSTSFDDRHYSTQFDASLAWPQLTGFSLGPSPFDLVRSIRSYSHETRLTSDSGGPWEWLAGIYLSHSDEDFQSNLLGPDSTGVQIDGRTELREDRANEAALFGQLAYNFTEQLSLSAGARVFDASHNVAARGSGLLVQPSTTFDGANKQNGFAPQFVLSYRPNYDTTLYVQYSEGYRLGGINVDGPPEATGEQANNFDSDILRNYEAGAKARLLDGRAFADVAVYFDRWRDVQTDQIARDGAFYILNAGDVNDLGVEIDATVLPLRNLSLSGNFFWNNSVFSHANPALATGEAELPGAPDLSFGVSGRYDIPINDQTRLFAASDYSYVGKSHLGFGENTPAMGGYRITNFHIGLYWRKWQLAVFVDNLTNDRGNTFAFGNPFTFSVQRQITPPQPRTIGLSLAWTE